MDTVDRGIAIRGRMNRIGLDIVHLLNDIEDFTNDVSYATRGMSYDEREWFEEEFDNPVWFACRLRDLKNFIKEEHILGDRA